MGTKSFNYRYLSKNFVTIPYVLILTICFGVYLLSDMVSSMKKEIDYVKDVNHLLAQTTTSKNANLISTQVQYISDSMTEIESINFFPTQTEQIQEQQNLSIYTIFFGSYYTLHEPVTLHIDSHDKHNSQLIGYINTTVNLKNIRSTWFSRNVPMFMTVIIASFTTLLLMLKFLKKATRRLPLLEDLSEKILKNEDIDEKVYETINSHQKSWLYEKALFHLFKNQKTQQHNIDKLNADLILTKDVLERQIEQYSNFQSSLTHELKLSLDDIISGLKLLESQYISNEQKGAVDMINMGADDLNTKLNELILLNRIEKGQTTIELKQFNPTHVLNNIVERFATVARDKNLLLLAKSYHADYTLEGDLQKIEIIISSLVENALNFTDTGKVIIGSHIQHLENNIRWTIQVIDTGIGIDKPYLHQIFQPFFQIDTNKKRSKLNTTTGLFLTQKFADLINATIEVESELAKGSTFTLHILLKDWNNQTEQQVFQDKKIAIWYKNENVINQAQRLINTNVDIQRFKDSELLLDYLNNNLVDLLIITFKISADDVFKITKQLREAEESRYFRTLILYYYNPKYLTAQQNESLKTIGVDYLENIKEYDANLNEYLQRIVHYLG